MFYADDERISAEVSFCGNNHRAAVALSDPDFFVRPMINVNTFSFNTGRKGVAAWGRFPNVFLSFFLCMQVKRALNLVQMMRSEGIAPTEITYNVVFRLCGLGGCWAMGLELMTMMEVTSPHPFLRHADWKCV